MIDNKEASLSICDLIKPKYHVDINSNSNSRSLHVTPQVSQSNDAVAKLQRSLSWLVQNYQPTNLSLNDDDEDDQSLSLSSSSSSDASVRLIDIKQLVGQVDFDLNKLFQSPTKVQPVVQDEPKEKKKKHKWRKIDKELLSFRTKASANYELFANANTPVVQVKYDEPVVYGLDEPEEVDWDDGPINDYLPHDETVSSYYSKKSSKYYNSVFSLSPDRSLNFGCVRRKQSNKRIKLKTAVKRNDLLKGMRTYSDNSFSDYVKRFNFSHKSMSKNNTRLHIKYNILSKFENFKPSYLGPKERCKFVYGVKKIDKARHISTDAIKQNKKLFKYEGGVKPEVRQREQANQQRQDPASVIQHSLDRNLVNAEINQNYDDLYVEFLISIQHREITPEDYEYLSRLDELVKKKTVNESVLNKLKVEKVSSELLSTLEKNQEVCGICLDPYQLEQTIKHLPCGHKFHSECIDSWLKSQSNICPLDKKPVDESTSTSAASPAPAQPAPLSRPVSRLTTQQSWMIGLDQADIDLLVGANSDPEAPVEHDDCTEAVHEILNTLIVQIEAMET